MAGLGETTARLAKLKRGLRHAATAPGGDGRMASEAFAPNPGGLVMRTHIPADLPPGAPLVVVLHGCTQSAEAYAAGGGWLTLADRHGFAVLAPEQTAANNANRCFNWFEPGDSARGRGEAASVRAMVAHLVEAHGLDPARVFVTGLSAGGAMTAVMLAAYPEVFAAGAVIAGVPYGVAGDVREALAAMHGGGAVGAVELGRLVERAAPPAPRPPRLTVWHGQGDHTVAPVNAARLARQWASVHGLPEAPSETRAVAGRTRARWLGPDGEVLVESNLVAGLGHGAPLAAGGPEGIGAAGPYMLEAGVSSTLEILRFWGLMEPAAEFADAPAAPSGDAAPRPGATAGGVADQVMASVSGRVPDDVRDIIESALKAAGLRR